MNGKIAENRVNSGIPKDANCKECKRQKKTK